MATYLDLTADSPAVPLRPDASSVLCRGCVDVRILGPLEVWSEGRRCALGGSTLRALAVDLALHANEVVAAERLIDDLWGERASENAATALRVTISRLRKALPADTVVTRPHGYMLRVGPDELDLFRFQRLLGDARGDLARHAPADAVDRLGRALALWRGPALADVAYEAFARAAISRLEELRLSAVELKIEAELALGRHGEVVGELEALAVEHPVRERLHELLMLALYRSGRQAEALDVYREARGVLREELGIDPGTALQAMEQSVLRHDPRLDLASAAPRRADDARERSILVGPMSDHPPSDALSAVAETLAANGPRVLVLARVVPEPADLAAATAALQVRRAALADRGILARVAVFTGDDPAMEVARLAADLDVELFLTPAPPGLLVEAAFPAAVVSVLTTAPCDVALLASAGKASRAAVQGAVVVPFGGGEHDWAAIELGAWLARARGASLRLVGAVAAPERGRRDASRLLSHASLAVQRVLGVPAEPILTEPGPDGVLEAVGDGATLVLGLSDRWPREGLGAARVRIGAEAPGPVLFVRRGLRPGGLAPRSALTRYTWSVLG